MKCDTCFYWSELIAEARGCGTVYAMCLNENSDKYNAMVSETNGCEDWEDGSGGVIDAP
jgi:hypothetical protein